MTLDYAELASAPLVVKPTRTRWFILGLFALFSAGGALFCYAFVVETRGAALSDVQRLFSDQPPSEVDALLAPRV